MTDAQAPGLREVIIAQLEAEGYTITPPASELGDPPWQYIINDLYERSELYEFDFARTKALFDANPELYRKAFAEIDFYKMLSKWSDDAILRKVRGGEASWTIAPALYYNAPLNSTLDEIYSERFGNSKPPAMNGMK